MFTLIIQISIFIAGTLAGLSIIYYLPRLICWFSPIKKQKRLIQSKSNKIALIIPARNESKVIGSLLDSLNEQTYNKDNFDYFVVVKEPDDPTIQLVNDNGGIVVIDEKQTCKGDALDYTLQYIFKNFPHKYDAYLIVDADCVLDNKMLEEMNNGLASGKQVIQAKKIVKNYLYSDKVPLSAACNGLIWPLIDDLGNLYKTRHNIVNMTIGTGIMIRSDVIEQLNGWPYRETLTEDIEFMYDCVYKNYSTFYYSYAKIYVEEANTLSMTNKRRTRWLTGVIDSKRIYTDKILEKGSLINIYYSTALTPTYVYFGTLTIFSVFHMFLTILLTFLNNNLWITSLICSLSSLFIIYLSFFVLTVACLLVDNKNIKLPFYKKILVLFVHPLFYMEYIRIIGKALLFKNKKGWEVIERVDFQPERKE